MGLFCDLTLGSTTLTHVYLSPRYISANRDAGHYVMDYFVTKGGERIPVPDCADGRSRDTFEFSVSAPRFKDPDTAAADLARVGIVFDRNKPAHEQAYADLKAKVAAGQVAWLSNLADD